MKLPTEKEINPHGDPDGVIAAQHWHGKNWDDGVAMLEDNPLFYQEDFCHMGYMAFSYYLCSVELFIKSKSSIGDEDFVHGLICTLDKRCNEIIDNDKSSETKNRLLNLINYILNNYKKFYKVDSFLRDIDFVLCNKIKHLVEASE